jgi:hypothetical protein
MPTGVSLFVWLPEGRARCVEMRAKRDRAIRAMFGQCAPISIRPRPRGWSCHIAVTTAATASKQ